MSRVGSVPAFRLSVFMMALAWLSTAGDGTCAVAAASQSPMQHEGYTGSVSCRECHEKFYKLWEPSHHGKAMQPYTPQLAREKLTPQGEALAIGHYRYRAEIEGDKGYVMEHGPDGEKRYPMEHVLGGKNVYYFLTPMEKGRLQTLPVAYDVARKEWFDTAGSGVRHFPDSGEDEVVHWKDWPYTFNTACYNCHVSQLSTNYDPQTDTYNTVWVEPGINCETCHGPAQEHIRVCREAPKGTVPKDLKTIRGGRDFTPEQNNDTCSTCHSKGISLTSTVMPGDRYFDHFDLVALENPDFYPDGRDLGENYTLTLWRMSPCAKSGQLHCLHCHTSSGRFRQRDDPNQACVPCHADRVQNAAAHTRHPSESAGNKCISCHMPMTEFARMGRSDHSMLPPTPAATLRFQSPNACNLCHTDKDAAWADAQVRQWRDRDYQGPILHRAELIDAARKRNWEKLPHMLAYLKSNDRDEIVSTSLIRLLQACSSEDKWPVLLIAMKDPSPLVRSAAAESLAMLQTQESLATLIQGMKDEIRLVRVRAAGAFAHFPPVSLDDQDKLTVQAATDEYISSLSTRPDHWDSHYNLGNYFMNRGDLQKAVTAFEKAIQLEPRSGIALVNASIAHARLGENGEAEALLGKALEIDGKNAAANFNMGLLRAEQGDMTRAEAHLRAALQTDPKMAEAAYNLGILLARDHPEEALQWSRTAYTLNANPKYASTLAYFLNQGGDAEGAVEVLRKTVEKVPPALDPYLLLGEIYEKQGKVKEAEGVYHQGLSNERLSMRERSLLDQKIGKLSASGQ